MTRLDLYGWCLCLLLVIVPASYADELPPVTEEGQRAMAVVDQVWAHLAEGDAAKTLAGHLQPEDPKLLERLTEALESQAKLAESGMLRLRAVYARIEGDWALVPVRVTVKREDGMHDAVYECWAYRQPGKQGGKKGEGETGAWKIVSEAVMKDSRIKPLRNDDWEALQDWWHEHAEQLTRLRPEKEPSEAGEE